MYTNKKSDGVFREKSFGHWFTFRTTNDAWAKLNGFTHEIDVLDGIRFAIVGKTVAKVAVDENADGKPVVENWSIKNRQDWS